MQANILFDNIYIGSSIEDAERLKKETYDVKIKIEQAEDEASKPKTPDPAKSPMDLKFLDDPMHYMRENVDLFMAIAKNSGIVEAARFVPQIAAGLVAVTIALIGLVIAFITMGKPDAAPMAKNAAAKSKETVTDIKDRVVDATSSAAENVQGEVKKRTTRSSGSVE